MDCPVTNPLFSVATSRRCPHPTGGLSRRRLVPQLGAGLTALSSLRREPPATTAKARHKKRKHHQRDTSDTSSGDQQTGNQQAGTQKPGGASPLVGPWREDVQFACGTGAEITPARPIQELYFRDDGTITVTWIPFELYYDYVGTYTADLAQGTLRFQANRGNYLPKDLDSEGHIAVDAQGRLLLPICGSAAPRPRLGSPPVPSAVATASASGSPDARSGGRAG